MIEPDAITMIEHGVSKHTPSQIWADLGAGDDSLPHCQCYFRKEVPYMLLIKIKKTWTEFH
jgi:hypothetical protein